MSKVWFITGTSRGFGRSFAEAALSRGDKVAATARNLDSLSDLVDRFGDAVLPLQLDVTDREAAFAAVKSAHEHFGRLDVVVNNAGYGLFGTVEELSETEIRDQVETNLFGVLWVTQAALPIMRAQQSGHIVQVSTIGGLVTFPTLGAGITRRSGRSRASPTASLRRSQASASRSRSSSPHCSPPTGPAAPRCRRRRSTRTTVCAQCSLRRRRTRSRETPQP